MAGTATVTIGVVVSGGNAGQVNESNTWANTTANEQVSSQTLSAGNNTVTVPTLPTNPLGVVLIPPAANTQALILKGVNGDTGITIHPSNPFVLTFPASPPASFVLNAGGTVTGMQFRWI